MVVLPNFPEGDIENLLDQAPKKSTTTASHAAPERFIGKRQTSAYSDNLSLDMAEARWDILQTLLLEERQAREADMAELRKELSMERNAIKGEMNECREVQKQMELRIRGFEEAHTVLTLQEELKSSLQQMQIEFELRIANIQEKLEENMRAAGNRKDAQPAVAIPRVASLERPASLFSLTSPRAERIKPQLNPLATDTEDQDVPVVMHGIRSAYDATSFIASMPRTLQPSTTPQTTPQQHLQFAWQCASPKGSESAASTITRTYNRNATPMVARGIGVTAPTQSQSPRLVTAHQMVSKQETSAPQWASPTANFRMAVNSPAEPRQRFR